MYEKPTFTHMTEKDGVEFNTFRKINNFKGYLAVSGKMYIFASNIQELKTSYSYDKETVFDEEITYNDLDAGNAVYVNADASRRGCNQGGVHWYVNDH